MGSTRRPTSMADFLPPYSYDEARVARKASAQRRYDQFQTQRRQLLQEQASDSNSAAERIRIWEQLHALRLPANGAHRLVEVIASQTKLALRDVQEEQLRRAASHSE